MIYITSDLHFGHPQEFLFGPRGFNTIQEHDIQIIKNYNSIVTDEDEVYLLGDCMVGCETEYGIECLKQLKGKIHLIYGNHDTNAKIAAYKEQLPNFIFEGYSTILTYKKYHFYLSHYPAIVSNYDADKPLKARVISLCGHSHTQDKFQDFDKGLIYHCELDAHDNKPVSIDTIIEDVKEFIDKK